MRSCWGVWAVAAGVLLGASLAFGQATVPPDLQASIIARMLGYDRALKARVGPGVEVGVVFKASDAASSKVQADIVKAFKALEMPKVQGLPITCVAHAFKDATSLGDWASRDSIDVLYITPGLDAEMDAIRGVARDKKLVTISPVRALVEHGLALGVVIKGDTPRILVNMPVAQTAGMDLDPKLLQLSEVIR